MINVLEHEWINDADMLRDEGTKSDDLNYLTSLALSRSVKLPEEYCAAASVVQGLFPLRSAFVVWNKLADVSEAASLAPRDREGHVRNIGAFANLGREDEDASWPESVAVQLTLIGDVAPGLFPFAFDMRGNLICLDYGRDWSATIPRVAYYDRARVEGDDILPIARDFGVFMESLMLDESETAYS